MEILRDGAGAGRTIESDEMNWHKFAWILAILALMGMPGTVRGQAGLDPQQLPKSTVFYVAWHGMPTGGARSANSLLALWDDADFAPARAEIMEQLLSGPADSKKTQKPMSKEELAEVASLLDNELVAGYLSDPEPAKAGSKSAEVNAHKWNGLFFVYDRTGKEGILAKLLLRAGTSGGEPAKISEVKLAGIAAMKIESKSRTSYWAEDGKYAYGASEPAAFEQLVAWSKHAAPEAGWLAKTAGYKDAGEILKGGVVQFYFQVPSLKSFGADANPGGFRMGPMLQNLKIDSVHCIAGQIGTEGARTRVRGAILGDASPGTPFDIWSAGVASPGSLQLVNNSVISYQTSQINLLGIYGLIKRALSGSGGGNQKGPADFVESAVQAKLAMSVREALGQFSGEVAAIQSNAGLDPAKKVYVIGIKDKPEALKLMHRALEERISGERSEGDTTFFRVSEGGIQSGAGTATWKYYQAAVTPDFVVVASRNEALREALARKKSAGSDGLQLPAAWQTARAQFPATLSGLAFTDFQKVDWAAAKEKWSAKPGKAGVVARPVAKADAGTFENALRNLDPKVLQRHLHLGASGSWKDAQGVHVDGWIE